MAQVKVQFGCGCEGMIESPGPDDPQGLLARLAGQGVHRTGHPCQTHKDGRIVRLPGWEHSSANDAAMPAGTPAPPVELCDFEKRDEKGQIVAACMLVAGHDGDHALQPVQADPGQVQGQEDCDFTKGKGRGLLVCTLPAGHTEDHHLVPIAEVAGKVPFAESAQGKQTSAGNGADDAK